MLLKFYCVKFKLYDEKVISLKIYGVWILIWVVVLCYFVFVVWVIVWDFKENMIIDEVI